MKLPDGWYEEIIQRLKSMGQMNKFGWSILSKEEQHLLVTNSLDAILDLPFNKEYEFPCDPPNNTGITYKEAFKDFFISVIVHQSLGNFHPLTCCSNHEILMPRIDFNKNLFLICPTCGYIQPQNYVPIIFPRKD